MIYGKSFSVTAIRLRGTLDTQELSLDMYNFNYFGTCGKFTRNQSLTWIFQTYLILHVAHGVLPCTPISPWRSALLSKRSYVITPSIYARRLMNYNLQARMVSALRKLVISKLRKSFCRSLQCIRHPTRLYNIVLHILEFNILLYSVLL